MAFSFLFCLCSFLSHLPSFLPTPLHPSTGADDAHMPTLPQNTFTKKRNSIAAAAEGHEDAKPFLVLKEGDRRQENDCCGGVGGGGRTERQRSTFMHMRKGGGGGAEGGRKRGGEDAHPAPLLISSLVMQP